MSRKVIVYFAGFSLLVSLCAGCATSPPNDVVHFDARESCPRRDDAQLTENINRFDDTTDTITLQCALERLRNAKKSPIDEDAAGAQICFLLADRSKADQTRRERLAAEGLGRAERALAQGGEERGDVYYYLAVNLGITVEKHPVAAVKSLDRIVANLEKALALSPDIHSAGPYRVLGMVYLKAPPWPTGIGDGDQAQELLAEAVRRSPAYPLNRIFYARALWEVEGEDAEREIAANLEEALRLMNGERWRPVRERWMDEVTDIAGKAQVELPVR
jgi:tetratricopeptide (TPR) repeat protein